MSFVKLDCGILDSTLWVDRASREIFITALLMAEPYEVKEPMDQINVRDLSITGFAVPPGWYGFVPAAGTGIVRRAGLEPEEGLAALERLGAADPESRSPNYEGRRLVRVSGGFIVLNFMHYRDYDHTAATRMKNLRERRKTGSDARLKMQDGKCDCCGKPFEKPLHLYVVQDHWHGNPPTNRGLICSSCNRIVGQLENGQPCFGSEKALALAYISKWEALRNAPTVRANITEAEAEAESRIENSPQPPKGGDGAGRTAEPEPPTPPKAGKAENLPPIPVVLDTPNFRKVWDEWRAYRKPLGGVKDWPKLWTRQLDQLSEYGEPGAIASLKASMVGGWRGLFPPRGLPGLAGKPRTSGPDLSDWARRQRGAGASPAGGAA